MTGYKGYEADTNVFRADGQSDHYGAFATMWGALIICYMFFLTLMYPLEVITSF